MIHRILNKKIADFNLKAQDRRRPAINHEFMIYELTSKLLLLHHLFFTKDDSLDVSLANTVIEIFTNYILEVKPQRCRIDYFYNVMHRLISEKDLSCKDLISASEYLIRHSEENPFADFHPAFIQLIKAVLKEPRNPLLDSVFDILRQAKYHSHLVIMFDRLRHFKLLSPQNISEIVELFNKDMKPSSSRISRSMFSLSPSRLSILVSTSLFHLVPYTQNNFDFILRKLHDSANLSELEIYLKWLALEQPVDNIINLSSVLNDLLVLSYIDASVIERFNQWTDAQKADFIIVLKSVFEWSKQHKVAIMNQFSSCRDQQVTRIIKSHEVVFRKILLNLFIHIEYSLLIMIPERSEHTRSGHQHHHHFLLETPVVKSRLGVLGLATRAQTPYSIVALNMIINNMQLQPHPACYQVIALLRNIIARLNKLKESSYDIQTIFLHAQEMAVCDSGLVVRDNDALYFQDLETRIPSIIDEIFTVIVKMYPDIERSAIADVVVSTLQFDMQHCKPHPAPVTFSRQSESGVSMLHQSSTIPVSSPKRPSW